MVESSVGWHSVVCVCVCVAQSSLGSLGLWSCFMCTRLLKLHIACLSSKPFSLLNVRHQTMAAYDREGEGGENQPPTDTHTHVYENKKDRHYDSMTRQYHFFAETFLNIPRHVITACNPSCFKHAALGPRAAAELYCFRPPLVLQSPGPGPGFSSFLLRALAGPAE